MLSICAQAPGHGGYAEDDGAHDGGVGLPVRGLCIPPSCRRPDVFGVAGGSVSHWSCGRSRSMAPEGKTHGILGPPLRNRDVGRMVGWVSKR